jgi:hypothetical protein
VKLSRCVIYFLCGRWRQYLGPLVVSLHSLRKWWDGPVCVMAGNDILMVSERTEPKGPIGSPEFFRRDCEVAYLSVPLAPVRRHAAYVTKSSLWRQSPFDQTVLLDADTIVTGPIDELFDSPLTLTKFAHWITTGRIVGGRIAQWERRGIHVETAQRLRSEPQPAINTGVVGWNRTRATPILEAWEALSREGWACSFTDELAMQILAAERPDELRLVDDRFNCSASFGQAVDDVRVLHFHGRRMIPGRGKPDCAALYRPHLLAALEANAGWIADWLEEIDPPLWELAKCSPGVAV